jgi:hypothetical protein
MIFFSKTSSNRKEPELEPELELQFVISDPAPGGNLISAPRLSVPTPQNCWPVRLCGVTRVNLGLPSQAKDFGSSL